jgi:WD40 repeat-containing protein SMU1
MMHDDAVLCAAISRNAEMLATASKSGQIKVWKIMTGKCLRKFEQAHTLPISSMSFLKDGSSLVTGSHDNLLRVHGLKSGKMLKELRGHKSFVTSSAMSPDGARIIRFGLSCSVVYSFT